MINSSKATVLFVILNQGIANGMFSHIMGYKHRQMFIEEIYKESNLAEVLDLSQSQLLDYARKHAENGDNLNEKIKTRRSDEVGSKEEEDSIERSYYNNRNIRGQRARLLGP